MSEAFASWSRGASGRALRMGCVVSSLAILTIVSEKAWKWAPCALAMQAFMRVARNGPAPSNPSSPSAIGQLYLFPSKSSDASARANVPIPSATSEASRHNTVFNLG
eukprot:scaffold39643_cov71-Phaeocystis_antarctica.AAC.5